jgi:hypothetical protein
MGFSSSRSSESVATHTALPLGPTSLEKEKAGSELPFARKPQFVV